MPISDVNSKMFYLIFLISRILNFLDNLSFCEVDESSETAALASNSYAIDNDTHKILLQVFQTLMRQSSKQILKVSRKKKFHLIFIYFLFFEKLVLFSFFFYFT